MGSAKILNAKPQSKMAEKLKKLPLLKVFFPKDKKKEKAKAKELIEKQNEPRQPQPTKTDAVASILESFKKLDIEPKITKANIEETQEDDELKNFTIKIVEDDRRSARIDSESSTDSGFADRDEVAVDLEKQATDKTVPGTESTKEIENQLIDKETSHQSEKGKKKLMQVLVKRAPVRNKICDSKLHPYGSKGDTEHTFRQISQINRQTLTGGHLIVNTPDNYSELDLALQSVSQIYQTQPDNEDFNDLLEFINEDITPKTDVLSEFEQISAVEQNFHIEIVPEKVAIPNAIEEFNDSQQITFEDSIDFPSSFLFGNPQNESIFPTPPRSENVPSPMTESQAYYASNSEYTLSPERSSPIYNSDFEKYQEISPLSFEDEEKETKGASVSSSMTMKNFKDLQKEIANGFSKKECCDIERKPTNKVFEEHLQKLKAVERKNLCLKVSKLDMKTAYGVLHHSLLALSRECDQEDLQYALFALVIQQVLAHSPQLFAGDFGLSILKAAALRCPHRPLLTRHIVHCVYLVLRNDPTLCTNECVFHEVDALGDNLVIACARGGDAYALVLSEITRSDLRGDLPPLFRLHHANADGHTALHVACREHSAANGRLHTVHVLLEHASADIWKGDIKGGDTPLHLAVNSTNCCLQLVMMLFKHVDRKLWKKLAHAQNMSSVTPLEYARSATKSTTRKNYPTEVLEFLKKCR